MFKNTVLPWPKEMLSHFSQKQSEPEKVPHLLESTSLLQAILQQTASGVVICDPQGHIVFINDVAKQLVAPQLDNLSVDSTVSVEDRVCYPDGKVMPVEEWSLSRALRGEMIVQRDERICRPDGTFSDILVTAAPLRNEQQEIIGVAATCIDITNRKQKEQAQLVAAAILENSEDPIVGRSIDGIIITWNVGAKHVYGYSAEEALGQPISLLTPPGYEDEHQLLLQSLQQGEQFVSKESKRLCKDGSVIEIALTASPIRDEQGNIIGISVVGRDITRRKQLEQSLRDSEKRFRELADAMPQLVWTANPDGTVDYYNQRYKEFQSIGPDEDGTWHWGPVVHADELQATVDAWQHAVATGNIYEIEHRILQNDGDYCWYLSRGIPTRGSDGQIVKWYGTATNIHAQKQAEEKISVILNSISDGLLVLNDDWIITYFNLAAEQLLNVSAQDVLGRYFFNVFPAAKGTMFEDQYRWALRERQFTTFEAPYEAEPYENWYSVRVYPQEHGISVYFQVVTDRKHTEEALRKSEASFRQLANSMPQLVWAARPDGTIDYINERYQEYNGIKQMPNGNWDWEPAIHPDETSSIVAAWQHSLQTGETYQAEHYMFRADGSVRWHLSRAVPVRNDAGQIIRWFGTATDIHDHKLAQERITVLQEVTASLSQAATVSDFANILMDKTLKAIGAHLGAVMMLTPDQTELVLVNSQGIPPKDFARYQRVPLNFSMPVTDAARTGEPVWIESQDDFAARYPAIVSIVKESTHSQAIASVPLVVENRVVGSFLVSFLHPVTFTQEHRDFLQALAQQYAQAIDRARLYEIVQQERDRSHAILNSMTEEVWFCDAEGNLAPANLAAAPGLGLSGDEPIPLSNLLGNLETYYVDGVRRAQDEAPILRSLQTGEIVTAEEEIVRHLQTGELRYRQVSSAPIHSEAGKIIGAVAVVRDITDQKIAERQSAELSAERERVRILTTFVERASHDFKTPISVINTSLYLLPKVADPEKQRHHLDVMRKQILRLSSLIEDMMTMVNLDGTPALTFSPLDMNRVVIDQQMAMLGSADDKDITVYIGLSDKPLFVNADEEAIRRALNELCLNAIQFTPPGGTVSLLTQRQGNNVLFEVQDTGVGVSEEALPRIFERLYRADQARSTDTGGTGLGLSIAKRIVELHGGQLEVSSMVGHGSIFRVLLPLHDNLPSG